MSWLLMVFAPAALAQLSDAKATAKPERKLVEIGILAGRGTAYTLKRWQPTADYLNKTLPGYDFRIEPYFYDNLTDAVALDAVDFLLTNPSHYVELSAKYRVQRILTLQTPRTATSSNMLGAVIFTRANRADINSLYDLKGKSFMGVRRSAFCGFLMARGVLKAFGIDPDRDFKSLQFSGFPWDNVALAVRDGQVDAGTMRASTLHRMAAEGHFKMSDFKILHAVDHPGYPMVTSTPLYPNWPLAAHPDNDPKLTKALSVALLSLPATHDAALTGRYSGWTVPLNYQPVHTLLKDLKFGPYADNGNLTFKEVMRQYGPVIWAIFAVLCGALAWAAWTELLVQKRTRQLANEVQVRRSAEERQKFIAKELDHRVKNVLAKFSVVIDKSAEGAGSLREFTDILQNRVQSMSRTHSMLAENQWKGAALGDLIAEELAPYSDGSNLQVAGPDIMLKPDAAQSISAVIHELTTNAIKYGALKNPDGKISIQWTGPSNDNENAAMANESAKSGALNIIWREVGGPAVKTPRRNGFGTDVIEKLLPYKYNGTVKMYFEPAGLRCAIQLPLAKIAA